MLNYRIDPVGHPARFFDIAIPDHSPATRARAGSRIVQSTTTMKAPTMIKLLKSDETFSTGHVFDAAKKTDHVTFSVRATEKGPRYALTSTLDFSACSPEEILELAARTCVIDLQRQWRVIANTKGSTATTVNPFQRVNVKTAIVDNSRKTASPVSKAANAVNKLSEAEKRALIAELTASMTPNAPKAAVATKK